MTKEDAMLHMILRREELKHSVGDLDEDIKAFDMVIESLEQTRWIPVSERLPDAIGTYLVTLDYKEHGTGVTTLWFHNKEIGWDLRVADVVIAWMPLPQPYKGESEE